MSNYQRVSPPEPADNMPFRRHGCAQVRRYPPGWVSSAIDMDVPFVPSGNGKTIGKPWENHGKTMGKPWENDGLMGFYGILPGLVNKQFALWKMAMEIVDFQ